MHPQTHLADYLQQSQSLIEAAPRQAVMAACDALHSTFKAGKSVYACGNGGSAANASHFCEDLAKLMWDEPSGRRLRVNALTESTPFMTALANDDGYDRIFEIQLAMNAHPGDTLLCISGSGNSANVLRAARWARANDLHTIAFTGFNGGELCDLASTHVHVDSDNMGLLECVHMILLDFISKELRFRAYGTAHADR
jgi:D-sedoheptulose 7-phosphate isomerase